MRIITLLASATEIVCALGLEGQIVGRSHECDYPPSIKKLPICTEPKFPTYGASYEINQRLKAILQEGLSIYRIKVERINELLPDVLITQTQCEVCAVSFKDVQEAVMQFIPSRPRIISLNPNSLTDVWQDIQRIADTLDASDRGQALIRQLKKRMHHIEKRTRNIKQKPRVACIEWIDPLMVTGYWMPELVEMARGVHLFGEAGKHAPQVSWKQIVEKDPDILLILPCGFDMEKTRKEMSTLTQQEGWQHLRAVRNRQVFIVDGNQYFTRSGPRLVESLEMLAEIFHPDVFHFGHQGTGWEAYNS